ncbi:MAG: biosynthetic peptidoglycan transglycosylase [Candidatus Dormibacteria bacterium]
MALAVALLAVVLVLAATAFELSLPGVGDARRRAANLAAQHREVLLRSPVPHRLASALVAVEDENFYANPFVDVFAGVLRAGLSTLTTRGDPGGSTIEQQLCKQLYPQGRDTLASLRELGMGLKLALTQSRAEVLSMYFNVVYFGNRYWGIKAAAKGYFGTTPQRLSWGQAALLAGLPQAPTAYDPYRHPRLAKRRQLHVLDQLVANHYLSRAAASASYRAPLHLVRGHS